MTVSFGLQLRDKVVVLALVASVFTALYKAMDNITVRNFIVHENKLIAALGLLVIGGWIGVATCLVMSRLAGRIVDPRFSGIMLSNSVMHWRAGAAGFLAAVSTLFFLLGNQYGEPSGMIALTNSTLVYVVGYELAIRRLPFSRVVVPTVLVFIGSSLAAFTGSISVTLACFVLVVILSNGFDAAGQLFEKKGVEESDGISMLFWRILWLAITGTVLSFGIAIVTGQIPLLWEMIQLAISYWGWLVLLMLCVFFGIGLVLTLKNELEVSVVTLAMTVQVLMGYPITWIGDLISPGIFGPLPSGTFVWSVRVVGVVLLLAGLKELLKLRFLLKQEKEV